MSRRARLTILGLAAAVAIVGASLVIVWRKPKQALDARTRVEGAALAAYPSRTEELWRSVVQQGMRDGFRVDVPNVRIDPGRGVVDAHVESGIWGEEVHVGRDLILSLLRVAQATAYVFGGYAPASLDKSKAVGAYVQAVTKALAADTPDHPLRVPEVSEFFRMSKDDALALARDVRFQRLCDIQFTSFMTFILSHEYAHLALGHMRSPTPADSTLFFDQELDADRLGARLTGELTQDFVIGAMLPITFILSYYGDEQLPLPELRKLCERVFSVGLSDVENFRARMQSDPDVKAIMRKNGNDMADYERAAELFSRMAANCSTMTR